MSTATRSSRKRRTTKRRISPEARRAGIKRALKTTGFNVLGFLLVNAAAIAAAFFIGIKFGHEIATVLSLVIGAIAMGVQKSISWVDTGFDPEQTLTVPNPLAGG